MLLMYRSKTARRSMARETSRIGANNSGWLASFLEVHATGG
jgi:hypothetical protein